MLAHELTHVVQQRGGPVDGTPAPGGVRVSDPSDRFEREAVASADCAMSIQTPDAAPLSVQSTTDPALQRAEAVEEEEQASAQGSFVQREEGEDEEVG